MTVEKKEGSGNRKVHSLKLKPPLPHSRNGKDRSGSVVKPGCEADQASHRGRQIPLNSEIIPICSARLQLLSKLEGKSASVTFGHAFRAAVPTASFCHIFVNKIPSRSRGTAINIESVPLDECQTSCHAGAALQKWRTTLI